MIDDQTRNKIWHGEDDVVKNVKKKAKQIGDFLELHSLMLSTYMSTFEKQSNFKKSQWIVLMCWHSSILYWYRDKLNHMQLDVLISFLISTKKKSKHIFPIDISKQLIALSDQALELSRNKGILPHEQALILTTRALVLSEHPESKDAVLKAIEEAIELGHLIRTEYDKIQALRQFVRVLRKVGEAYGAIGETEQEKTFLTEALKLAQGEADTLDQAQKIQSLLDKFPK